MQLRKFLFFIMLLATGSCKPVAYFNTPNDVFKKEAVVTLLNGQEKEGELTIQLETSYLPGRLIQLKKGATEEKIAIDSILFYTIGNDHYYLKKIDYGHNGSGKLLFLKELTKENSRIGLYELFEQRTKTADAADHYSYFISIPGHDRMEVWNTGGPNLVPDFENKMSSLVKDCPALADKIKQKDKDYFLTGFTLSDQKRVQVLQRIITEYNDCH